MKSFKKEQLFNLKYKLNLILNNIVEQIFSHFYPFHSAILQKKILHKIVILKVNILWGLESGNE